MKLKISFLFGAFALLLLAASAMASAGSGEVRVGYVYLDEEGNQSVYHPTFNLYEGPTISLEGFRYRFANGMIARANLKNIIMNNRNLNASLAKPGVFDLRVGHDQFRRIYNFDESSYTRRHQERASLRVTPVEHVELFGGVLMMERTGTTTDLFNPTPNPTEVDVDYKRSYYNFGAQFNYRGSMILGEYRADQYTDNNDEARDQKRAEYRFTGLLTYPKYDFLKLIGGFRHFETEFDQSGFMISNNRGYGGGVIDLPQNISLKYVGVLDRTSSDSDFVATDNMMHTGYLSYTRPLMFGITLGYQYDANDDFEDEVRGKSFYVGGWTTPRKGWEVRYEFGNRKEEVEDGVRLLGDEDRNRHAFSVKYRPEKIGAFGYKMTSLVRENVQLGTKADMYRFAVDAVIRYFEKYATLNYAYVHSQGTYENLTENFEFRDHLVSGDVTTAEYKGITLGFGALYYRSQRDLDIEHFNIRVAAALRFYQDYRFEAEYNAYNFDDLSVYEDYYTGNVVELSLIKGLSF